MSSPKSTIRNHISIQSIYPLALNTVRSGFLLLMLQASTAYSATNCLELARTKMEEAYCKVKASGHGKTLPSLQDFRNNPEQMQRLLLKNPAKKAKITLPEISHPSKKTTRDVQHQQPTKDSIPMPKTRQNTVIADGTQGISRCILQKNQIQCGPDYYLLRTNLPNHELEPSVLERGNQLHFPDSLSPPYSEESSMQYLSDCYPLYIKKMLSIGLGDSTMSFTQFVTMHEEIQKTDADFAKRFSEMFELLKMEKSNNAVRRRYNDTYPSNIEQCMFLSGDIIACDNVRKNWVYQR